MVFQQACLAVGMPARFIELGIPQTPACHFTTEVFLREPGKWAVVDATPLTEFKVYYTVDGVPQSALDMHRHVVDGTMDKVVEVHPDRSHKVEKKDSPAWTFYYVRWLTRCDVVTNTPKYIDLEHVFDKRWHTVEWTDEKTIPWEKQKHAAWYLRNERLAAWNISDPAVIDWQPTERVKILLCPGEEKWIFASSGTATASLTTTRCGSTGTIGKMCPRRTPATGRASTTAGAWTGSRSRPSRGSTTSKFALSAATDRPVRTAS